MAAKRRDMNVKQVEGAKNLRRPRRMPSLRAAPQKNQVATRRRGRPSTRSLEQTDPTDSSVEENTNSAPLFGRFKRQRLLIYPSPHKANIDSSRSVTPNNIANPTDEGPKTRRSRQIQKAKDQETTSNISIESSTKRRRPQKKNKALVNSSNNEETISPAKDVSVTEASTEKPSNCLQLSVEDISEEGQPPVTSNDESGSIKKPRGRSQKKDETIASEQQNTSAPRRSLRFNPSAIQVEETNGVVEQKTTPSKPNGILEQTKRRGRKRNIEVVEERTTLINGDQVFEQASETPKEDRVAETPNEKSIARPRRSSRKSLSNNSTSSLQVEEQVSSIKEEVKEEEEVNGGEEVKESEVPEQTSEPVEAIKETDPPIEEESIGIESQNTDVSQIKTEVSIDPALDQTEVEAIEECEPIISPPSSSIESAEPSVQTLDQHIDAVKEEVIEVKLENGVIEETEETTEKAIEPTEVPVESTEAPVESNKEAAEEDTEETNEEETKDSDEVDVGPQLNEETAESSTNRPNCTRILRASLPVKRIDKFATKLTDHFLDQTAPRSRSSKMTILRQTVRKTIRQTEITPEETKSSISFVLRGRANVEKYRVEKQLNVLRQKQEIPEVKVSQATTTINREKSQSTPKPLSAVKKPRYREIDDCIICCDVDLVTENDRARRCKCKAANKNCGQESCLNRAMHYECPKKCDNGDQCKNRRFQNREYAKLECFDTELKGRGVRALEAIPKGTFIIEYIGEIIDNRKFTKRSKRYARDPEHTHHYVMSLNSNTYIDATKRGNIARFVNHSCDPNAATEKWTVDRRDRIGFFAVRDIQAGEEIVFDYKFERFGNTAQKCYCGSANCRGIICSESDVQRDRVVEETEQNESSSEDSGSSDEEGSEVEDQSPVEIKTKKKREVSVDENVGATETAKQQTSVQLTEKWQKVGFKDYKIPKKMPKVVVDNKPTNTSQSSSQSSSRRKASSEESTSNNDRSPPAKRRKSRFGPPSKTPDTSLCQPKLIQIPLQPSNSSCSNTCSSSSTPTRQMTPTMDVPTQTTQPAPRRKSRFEPIDAPSSSTLSQPQLVQLPAQTSTTTQKSPMTSLATPMPMFPAIPMFLPPPFMVTQMISMPPPPNGIPLLPPILPTPNMFNIDFTLPSIPPPPPPE